MKKLWSLSYSDDAVNWQVYQPMRLIPACRKAQQLLWGREKRRIQIRPIEVAIKRRFKQSPTVLGVHV